MKKIYSFILAAAALLALAPISQAQSITEADKYTDNGNGICYSKTISEPDHNGVYTITLESFVTGSVTIEQKNAPADIVLVLDFSGSMTNNYYMLDGVRMTRLAALKQSVAGFIEEIYNNDIYEDYPTNTKLRSAPLGNRIAVVVFSTNNSYSTTLLGLTYVTNNITSTSSSDWTINSTINTTVQSRQAHSGGTYSSLGMGYANDILSGISADRKKVSTRTVVLFTDGSPVTEQWNDSQSPAEAARCIAAAYTAKHTHDAKVFSIGLLSSYTGTTLTKIENYLNYTSSNYPDATGYYYNGLSGYNDASVIGTPVATADQIYYKDAGENLSSVFRDIAAASGGSGNTELSSAVTTVDVVSASFTLPKNADESTIQVLVAPCEGQFDETYTIGGVTKHYLKFGDDETLANCKAAEHKYTKTVDGVETAYYVADGIGVSLTSSEGSTKKNLIKVNGFDYSANWCGEDATSSTGYHGHKVIIKIPILMDDEAVGGPNVETNASGSGIFTEVDGEMKSLVSFKSPTVSLPINIHINKIGLDVGESAKFLIQRAVIPTTWFDEDGNRLDKAESAYADLTWTDVTSVFVTRHSGQNTSEPLTKVIGLPSTVTSDRLKYDEDGNQVLDADGNPVYEQDELVYRIIEEKWSWSYSSTPLTTTISDFLVTNPFKYQNTKKDQIDIKVRHAESKATNTFKTGGGAGYDDSKSNGRTVITVTAEE